MKREKRMKEKDTSRGKPVPEGWEVVDFDPDFNEVNDYRPWCSEGRSEADDGAP